MTGVQTCALPIWACCMLSFCQIPVAQFYHWACTHVVLGFLGPFHRFWAPLSHLFSLGRPRPVCFPWASSALFLTSHYHELLLTSLGFSGPTTLFSSLGLMGLPSTPYFLRFNYFGPAAAYSHFFTSYTTHGLLFLSFRALLSPFTSSRPICLSHGPVIHYSRCLGLMGFLLNLLTLFFSYC